VIFWFASPQFVSPKEDKIVLFSLAYTLDWLAVRCIFVKKITKLTFLVNSKGGAKLRY